MNKLRPDDEFFDLPEFTAPMENLADEIPYNQAVTFFEEIIEAYHLREQPDDRDTPVEARFEI